VLGFRDPFVHSHTRSGVKVFLPALPSSLCPLLPFPPFLDAVALLLDPATESRRVFVRGYSRDLTMLTLHQTNKPPDTSVQIWQNITHDLVIPTSHIFPALFHFLLRTSHFPRKLRALSLNVEYSLFWKLTFHEVAESLSWKAASCLDVQNVNLPRMEPKIHYRLHNIKPLEHNLT
jgi:hypothetical protein